MYPIVRFRLNKPLDKKMGAAFLDFSKAGVFFGEKIIQNHPSLKTAQAGSKGKRKYLVSSYVESFYDKQWKELENIKDKFQYGWGGSAQDFFKATSHLFNNHPWPPGKYYAYLSIFNCNPRFLKEKTFQVFWEHPNPLAVIAHEMLHFLFYDYVGRHFPKTKIKKEVLWQLSEIVNSFALAEPVFVEITKEPTPPLYRDLIPLAKELLPLWKKSKNVPRFLYLRLTKTFDQEQGKGVGI